MSETCEFCGEGATEEKGEPMYYEDRDIYAHMECAIENEVGME
jgi:hypothetical protein